MSRLYLLSLATLASGILNLPSVAQNADQEAPANYQLKNRSSFTAKDTGRTPFWPIGHVKRGQTTQAAPVAIASTTKLEPEMFAVTSILLGNPALAVINGRAYGEGELLRPSRTAAGAAIGKAGTLDSRVRVRVTRIRDGQVVLQSLDGQSITVPLRRAEVSTPSPVEEPALPEN